MDFSINTSECKVGQASALRPNLGRNEESVVVPFDRCARDRGGENVGLGEHSSNLLNLDIVCCRTRDEAFGKMNVEGSTYYLHRQSVKIIQVFQPTIIFNLHVRAEEKKIGVLEYYLMMMLGIG